MERGEKERETERSYKREGRWVDDEDFKGISYACNL